MKVFSFIVLTLLTTSVQAELPICLNKPSRTEPCPNLVYRSVINETTQQRQLVCFCKSDLEQLLKKDVTKKQRVLNRMELKQLLAEHNLTKQQLQSWLKN